MSLLIPNRKEIRSLFNAAEFILDTRKQINRDLVGLSFMELPENGGAKADPLDELIHDLDVVLEALSKNGNLSQFIYKVDLPEPEFHKYVISRNHDELAFLIIQREAQKVYLRNKFKPA